MTIEDYPGLYALWNQINGFGIRSIDDSREGIERFIKRNPATSIVAEMDGKIVGSILCGHDGRQGYFYHVCVDEAYRRHGIGKAMVVKAMEALRAEEINRVCLIAFTKNDIGNAFWKEIGWMKREDLNYYDFTLNEDGTEFCIENDCSFGNLLRKGWYRFDATLLQEKSNYYYGIPISHGDFSEHPNYIVKYKDNMYHYFQ